MGLIADELEFFHVNSGPETHLNASPHRPMPLFPAMTHK